MKTVPVGRTYASTTKYGKKICLAGDSHFSKVRRNIFNNLIANGNTYLKSFSRAKVQHLGDFIELTSSEDKPDIVILHMGSNDITRRNVEDMRQVISIA